MVAGFTVAANASGGGSTTNVSFVALNPAFKLETNHTMATNSSLSAVVIGGTTKIPTNATTVELSVTAGGATAGVLNIFPAGNSSGGSGQFLSWNAGTTATQTIQENVGLADELTFALQGATAKLTATITGYSTQVTAGDVSGLDGSAGQVLTDNGTGGATWQPASQAYAATFGTTALSNTSGDTTIGTLAVPAGSYQVTLTADMFNSTANDYGSCHLTSPTSGLIGEYAYFNTTTAAKNAEIGTQGLLSTSGGTITLSCSDYNSITSGYLYSADIDAVQVGAVNGFTTNAATHGTSGVPGKQPGA